MARVGSKRLVSVDLNKKPWEQELPLHNRWHPEIPPVAEATTGELFRVEMIDFSGGAITKNPTADDAKHVDLSQVHYLSGPIRVVDNDGLPAMPGDLLAVEICNLGPLPGDEWGFTATFDRENGGGFLTDHFPHATKAIWYFEGIYAYSPQIPGVRFPGITHPGIIGTAPSMELLNIWNERERDVAENGLQSLKLCEVLHSRPLANLPTPRNCHLGKIEKGSNEWEKIAREAARTIPGRENGGNCDIKNLSRGSKVYLPVFVEGANLSTGDMHFSQGDGEVSLCGAIEMSGFLELKCDIIRGGMKEYLTPMGPTPLHVNPIFEIGPVEPRFSEWLVVPVQFFTHKNICSYILSLTNFNNLNFFFLIQPNFTLTLVKFKPKMSAFSPPIHSPLLLNTQTNLSSSSSPSYLLPLLTFSSKRSSSLTLFSSSKSGDGLASKDKKILLEQYGYDIDADDCFSQSSPKSKRKKVQQKTKGGGKQVQDPPEEPKPPRTTHKLLQVIGGTARRTKLLSPNSMDVRPMMEVVKGAAFDILQSACGSPASLRPGRWLDLYSGTGSVGIEALSRGCSEVHFVEMDPWVVSDVLRPNLEVTRFVDDSVIHTVRVEKFFELAEQFVGNKSTFDYISVTPPYEQVDYVVLMRMISESPFVGDDTFILVEYPSKTDMLESCGSLVKITDRRFGRTLLAIYGPAWAQKKRKSNIQKIQM